MTEVVLLSIKPDWAEAILNNEKKWEYRKKLPKFSTPYTVLLYATSPKQKIVGEIVVDKIIRDTVETVINMTIEDTPHNSSQIREYFGDRIDAYAMRIKETTKYDKPVELNQHPPMNFMYVEREEIL